MLGDLMYMGFEALQEVVYLFISFIMKNRTALFEWLCDHPKTVLAMSLGFGVSCAVGFGFIFKLFTHQ
jgi:hypothetical protein